MSTILHLNLKVNIVNLGVKGGGCAGFTYVWGLTTDDKLKFETEKPINDVLVLQECCCYNVRIW